MPSNRVSWSAIRPSELRHDPVDRAVADALRQPAELLAQGHERGQRLHLLGADGSDVDRVGDHAARQRASHLVGGDRPGAVLRLGCGRSQVWGDDDVVAPEQRVLGDGLGREDVERRPGDLAGVEPGLKRLEVDQLASGAVDDPHPVLHLCDRLGVDPVDRVGRLGQVDGDDVRLRVQVVAGLGVLDTKLPETLSGDELVEGDHLHGEGLGPVGNKLADPPEADHAERLAVQLVAGESRPRPIAPHQRCVRLGDVPAQGQRQGQRVLGGRDRVRLWGVDDHDAPLGGGVYIDVVDPRPGATDHLQPRPALDQFRRQRGLRANHDPVELADPLAQLVLGHLQAELDLEVVPQQLHAGLGDLLLDQDLRLAVGHRPTFRSVTSRRAPGQSRPPRTRAGRRPRPRRAPRRGRGRAAPSRAP